ncbi:MAG: hypothetical protein WB767_06380 [Nocardioides sp.]
MFVGPSRRSARRVLAAVASLAVLAIPLGTQVSADARPANKPKPRPSARVNVWTPAPQATITPGVMAYTDGSQCTTNFVFTDAVGGVYLGYAAHCAGTGGASDTNGCSTTSLPLDTPVSFVRGGSPVVGGTRLGGGTLAYSAWHTMNEIGTTDGPTCEYNDFALVKVGARDVNKVNPSVPFFGGPSGLDTNGVSSGDRLFSYGNSSLRGGLTALSPKFGFGFGDVAVDAGWSHSLYSLTPGVPGDSGSGFMSAGGKAVGVLSTVVLTPLPLSNNIGDLASELAFAQKHSGIPGLRLAKGTVKFRSVI